MKKLSSIILCLMLVMSMAITGLVSAYAVDGDAADEKSGTITINKYLDGSNKTTAVKDAGFTIYQVLELGEDGLYRVNTQFSGINNLLTDLATATAGSDGYLTYGKAEDLEAKISELQEKATTAYKTEKKTDKDGVAIFDNVAYGVYLVVETTVPTGYTASTKSFLVAVNAESPNPVAYPKNALIETDKKIVDGTSETKKATCAIGDTVNFKITSQVPTYDTDLLSEMMKSDPTRYSKIPYYFVDTMSPGLTLNSDTIKVKIGGTDFTDFKVSVKYYNENNNITTDAKHKTQFYVVIDWKKLYNIDKESGEEINYMGRNVEITYSAKLNEYAEVTTGSGNHVELKYTSDPASFDPDTYWDGTEPIPEDTIPDPNPNTDPMVYTYEMDLTKTFNGGSTVPTDVTNVKFTLKSGETVLKFTKVDNIYYPSNDSAASPVLSVDSNGKIKVKGIKAGTYELEETATANGYTKLTSPITIVVADTETAGVVSALTYEVGKREGKQLGKANTGIFEITVNNAKSQFNLPETGGMGLWIFTIGGAVVFAAAIIIFVSVRRKKSSK